MEARSHHSNLLLQGVAWLLVLVGLYLASLYSYLLFHSLAEFFSIIIAVTLFVIAWNSRNILDNNYLLLLGIGYLFVGGLDLVHTLAYKGMGVFVGHGPNLPTQLWIEARYLEAATLLLAPLFLRRRLNPYLALGSFALAALLLLLAVFGGIFPTCFVEGTGMTPFKIGSEYFICFMLAGALALLFRNHEEFHPKVLTLLAWSIVLTIARELCFTLYVHVYGLFNLFGHYLKILSFYLIYKAIIQTGLVHPYDVLFRNLKLREEAIEGLNAELQKTVQETTEHASELARANLALHKSEERLRMFIEHAPSSLAMFDKEMRYLGASRRWLNEYNLGDRNLLGLSHYEVFPEIPESWKEAHRRGLAGEVVRTEADRFKRADGSVQWLQWEVRPWYDAIGAVAGIVTFTVDITECQQGREHLAADLEAMTRLQHLGTLFVRDGKLSAVLSEIVEAAIAIAGADFGNIQLLNPATGELQIVAQRGFEQKWLDFWNTAAEGHGACGTALERGERVIVEDVEASPIFAGKPALDIQRQAGVRAVQSTPLISRDGQLLGMFSTHYRTPHQPDPRSLALTDLLARQAADIISRAQADQELELTRNQLSEAQKIAHLGSFEYVAATRTTVWSEEEYRIYGLDPARPSPAYDEMLSKCIHPDDAALLHETFTKAMQSRSTYELEHRIVQPDGSVRWVFERANPYFDEQGNLVRYIGTTLDITNRKRGEEETQRLLNIVQLEREKLTALVNSISDEVWFADTRKKFTLANPSALQEFGLDSTEEIDVEKLAGNLQILRADGSPRPVEEAPPLRALQGELVRNLEEIIRTPATGELRYRQVNSSPVRDGSGNLIGSVSVVRDITERKRAEEALKQAHKELEQRVAERTADLKHTVGQIQWEIMERQQVEEALRESEERLRFLASQLLTAQETERNRLALELHDGLGQSLLVLKMQLRAVKRKLPSHLSVPKEGLSHSLDYIDEVIENVRRMSHDLRPSILEDLGLKPALESLFGEFSKAKQIRFSQEMEDIQGMLSKEAHIAIYRIFQESLTNIAKHAQATEVRVIIKPQDGNVVFQVEDNGNGFDLQEVNHGGFSKRGMGLAAMDERVRLLGGEFQLSSKPGKGTKLTFIVPKNS